MEIVIVYGFTVLVSMVIKINHELILYKDLADNNYRFKKDFESGTNSKVSIVLDDLFVPVVNIFSAIYDFNNYINTKEDFIKELRRDDIIEKMSIYEEKEYKKNPNIINAYLLERKMDKKRYNSRYVDYENGKIFFQINNDLSMEIVDSTGIISRQSDDNQKYALVTSLENEIENRENNLSKEELEKEIEELQESKKYLENYKTYLINNKSNSLVLSKHK